ncbi:hypothetical protein [Domibacillus tundrae]|uniref:hypothetical protein n=1 Tax=Domibacillus tundrae TaxID=1587527 RepID=UPI000AE6E662|nr:hypothetical protein [Domibacillus tundrae]
MVLFHQIFDLKAHFPAYNHHQAFTLNVEETPYTPVKRETSRAIITSSFVGMTIG